MNHLPRAHLLLLLKSIQRHHPHVVEEAIQEITNTPQSGVIITLPAVRESNIISLVMDSEKRDLLRRYFEQENHINIGCGYHGNRSCAVCRNYDNVMIEPSTVTFSDKILCSLSSPTSFEERELIQVADLVSQVIDNVLEDNKKYILEYDQ